MGGEDLLRELLDERHTQVVALLTEVRDKLATQNGRVGTLERQVAVLEERSTGRAAAISGGLVGGAITALGALAEWVRTR